MLRSRSLKDDFKEAAAAPAKDDHQDEGGR